MILESFEIVRAGIETIAIIGLSIAAASTIATTVTGQIAAGQAEEAEQARRQQIQLRERRERGRIRREQQRERSRIRASSIEAGITPGTSSSVEAGISDTASQLNRNFSFLRQSTELSLSGSRALSASRRTRALGDVFSEAGQLGATIAANDARIARLFS